MRSTAIDRRALLAGGAALAGAAALPRPGRSAEAARRLYVSAYGTGAGDYGIAGFDGDGAAALDLGLPARGHDSAVAPNGRTLVAFARRPGSFALVIDVASGFMSRALPAAPGRYFQGHGAFSSDGALLYASERRNREGDGIVGVYDVARGYQRIGEFATGGLDAHQLALMPDGTTLAVCNGGLKIDPAIPRSPLNVPSMVPSLALVDRRDGTLLAQHRLEPELNRLCFHHLVVRGDGTVLVAMQYYGAASDRVPLLARLDADGRFAPLAARNDIGLAMRNYCGSIAVDAGGHLAAVSAPRGNLVTFWNVDRGEVVDTVEVADGCGVAATAVTGTFLLTSGIGGAFRYQVGSDTREPVNGLLIDAAHWDNHILTIDRG